jgi:hypothetical protein
LTVRWPQARAQDGSFGVIAAAVPAHASTVTTTARRHPQVLTGTSLTDDPEEGESRADFSKYLTFWTGVHITGPSTLQTTGKRCRNGQSRPLRPCPAATAHRAPGATRRERGKEGGQGPRQSAKSSHPFLKFIF